MPMPLPQAEEALRVVLDRVLKALSQDDALEFLEWLASEADCRREAIQDDQAADEEED